MVTSLLLALALHGHAAAKQAVLGNMFWEEPASVQQYEGYHPILRFLPGSSYMFVTPFFIQQGKYQVRDGHYDFRAVTAYELENTDKDKLKGDMNPKEAEKFQFAYAQSLWNFQANYNKLNETLYVTYPVKGELKEYKLYATTAGDSPVPSNMAYEDRGLIGVWHAPEPFPDRLDARTRYKIGDLEGLQRFFKEAMESDGAQFNIIGIKTDKTYRSHKMTGGWHRDGNLLLVKTDTGTSKFTISSDGLKLLLGNRVAFLKD